MTIHFDDTLMAHVFVPLPPDGHSDWMAGLNQLGPDTFKLTHRFRHADPLEPGASPWENIDRKSWYEGTLTGLSLTEAIAKLNMVATSLAQAAGTKVHLLVREKGETTEHLMDRFAKQPYANVKMIQPGTPEWEEMKAKYPKDFQELEARTRKQQPPKEN